jgi:uncharacterized protein YjbI with pentapeptide repeats
MLPTQDEPRQPNGASGLLGAALSLSLLLSTTGPAEWVFGPGAAGAVSGGGGISTPISNEDFSGKDLRARKLTKAVMRQTNFANANLEGVSLFGGLAIGET